MPQSHWTLRVFSKNCEINFLDFVTHPTCFVKNRPNFLNFCGLSKVSINILHAFVVSIFRFLSFLKHQQLFLRVKTVRQLSKPKLRSSISFSFELPRFFFWNQQFVLCIQFPSLTHTLESTQLLQLYSTLSTQKGPSKIYQIFDFVYLGRTDCLRSSCLVK